MLLCEGTDKPIVLHVSVDGAAIREALIRRRMPDEGAATAGFLSGLKKLAKKVARAKVWSKMGKAIAKTLKSPAFAAAIGVASVFCPAIAPCYVAARAAIATVEAVKRGDPKVLKNVGDLAKSAAANNPLAQQAVDALKAAEASPLAQFIPAVT